MQEFRAHRLPVQTLLLPRHLSFLFTASQEELICWMLPQPSPLLSLKNCGSVLAMAVDQSGETLCTAANNQVKLWDLAYGQETSHRYAKTQSSIQSLAFHPFDEFFASGSSHGQVYLWDIRHRQAMQTFDTGTLVSFVDFSPDGRWLICGSGSDLKLWDLTAGKIIKEFKGNQSCLGFEFHPLELKGVGIWQNQLQLLDLQSFSVEKSLDCHFNQPKSTISETALILVDQNEIQTFELNDLSLMKKQDKVKLKPWAAAHQPNDQVLWVSVADQLVQLHTIKQAEQKSNQLETEMNHLQIQKSSPQVYQNDLQRFLFNWEQSHPSTMQQLSDHIQELENLFILTQEELMSRLPECSLSTQMEINRILLKRKS